MPEFFLCIFLKKGQGKDILYVYFIQLKSATHKYVLFQRKTLLFNRLLKSFKWTFCTNYMLLRLSDHIQAIGSCSIAMFNFYRIGLKDLQYL